MSSTPYATGETRSRIEQALRDAGRDPGALTDSDLTPLEDFHSLGRLATLGLTELAAVGAGDRVLDAGSGIGGTARLLARTAGCHVTAIDLTDEFCDASRWLNAAVGLDERIDVQQGDVLALPFADASFDVVISQHVQMNIADKPRLYAEAMRVLTPGGRLALWDVTAGPAGPIALPVPWATSEEQSHLIAPGDLRALLERTGFAVTVWNDLTELGAAAMEQFAAAPPAQLGLNVYVPEFSTKLRNLIANARGGRIRLIQAVLTAPAAAR